MKSLSWFVGVTLLWGTGTPRADEPDARGEGKPSLTIPLPGGTPAAGSLEFILIRPGTFVMGCPSDERGRVGREWPPHRVTLTRPFHLGRFEVTQGQWEAVMGVNPAQPPCTGRDHPVHHVTWNDCQRFLARLNTLGVGTFRLPTEAEWEFACRAGTTNRFSFGDALECSDVREFCEPMDRWMWWGGNNADRGHGPGCKPVGRKLPNPWGLHDMHGNVWEWCSDGWGPAHERGPQTDPRGPAGSDLKVMRGSV